jgi:hypothetical protein
VVMVLASCGIGASCPGANCDGPYSGEKNANRNGRDSGILGSMTGSGRPSAASCTGCSSGWRRRSCGDANEKRGDFS